MPNTNSPAPDTAARSPTPVPPVSALPVSGFPFSFLSPSVPHIQRPQLLHHTHEQVNGLFQIGGGFLCALCRIRQVVVVQHRVIPDEAPIQAVTLFSNLLPGKDAPSLVLHGMAVLGLVNLLKVRKMLGFQRGGLAKAGHIGAQVVEPDFLGVAFVALAPGEEQHIGLDALGVENAGRQAENGMQITLVHQVTADFLAVAISKKHIVRQHHGGSGFAVGFQAAVDVLEEVQLFVAGGESEVIPRGALAALFGAERRIGKHQIKVVEGFALIG